MCGRVGGVPSSSGRGVPWREAGREPCLRRGARVLETVLPEVRKLGMREMTFEEQELAAKTLYATARRRWLSRRKR